MIFATVGTQLPFDRLLHALDGWAGRSGTQQVLAQTGQSGSRFRHISCTPFMGQAAFRTAIEQASLIVGHAGMGTILTAAELGKPVIIMPRRAALGEHRNDHQIATAAEMRRLPNVTVAHEADDLGQALDRMLKDSGGGQVTGIAAHASPELLAAVAAFVRGAA